jgi:hypothetical protein
MSKSIDEIKKIVNFNKKKYSWEKFEKNLFCDDKFYYTNYEIKLLKNLLLTKLPSKFRKKFYLIMTGTYSLLSENKNEYKKLLSMFNYLISKNHPIYKFFQKKIEIDINRSFPKSLKITNIEKNKLRNILSSFTIKNVSLNYIQGFNQIAVKCLIITEFNEEEAFWLFYSIIENYYPSDFFYQGIGIECDIELLKNEIYKRDIELFNDLNRMNGEIIFASNISKWFVSLFVSNLNENISNIIIDAIILSKGNYSIFKMYDAFYAILQILKLKIKNFQDFEDLSLWLNSLEFDDFNEDDFNVFIYYLFLDFNIKIKEKIKENNLNQKKFYFFEKKNNNDNIKKVINCEINKYYENLIKERNILIEKNIREKKKYKNVFNKIENIECECKNFFPICCKDLNFKYEISDFFISKKCNYKLNIINDYFINKFNNNNNNININNKNNNKIIFYENKEKKDEIEDYFKNVLFERKKHYCLNN